MCDQSLTFLARTWELKCIFSQIVLTLTGRRMTSIVSLTIKNKVLRTLHCKQIASICHPLLQRTQSVASTEILKTVSVLPSICSLVSVQLSIPSLCYPRTSSEVKSPLWTYKRYFPTPELREVLLYWEVLFTWKEGKITVLVENTSLVRPRKMLSSAEQKSWSRCTQATVGEFEKSVILTHIGLLTEKKLKLPLTLGRDTEQHIYYSSYQLHL